MSDAEGAATRSFVVGIFEPSAERLERLAAWYAAEHDRLVRFAYVLTRDVDAAEDLVQDAFIKMFRVRRPLEEAGYPAYARRVIVNLARSVFRRRAIERRVMAGLTPDESIDPDNAADMDARRALLALSVGDRACLALRFYEGQSDADIASILGISRAAANKRIARALERLRAHLKEE